MTEHSAPFVCILVSTGRNPVSGRPRRAAMDARAVELGLRIVPGDAITLLHAGAKENPALHEYLGMGISRLTCMSVQADWDVLPSLLSWLQKKRPALILCGMTSETGDCSGTLPYRLSHALQMPLVPSICDIKPDEHGTQFLQALPGGHRRLIRVSGPAVATVSLLGPCPRLPTLARARRGELSIVPGINAPDDRSHWVERATRQRPTRILQAVAGSAAERLRSLRGETVSTTAGESSPAPLSGLSPEAAASRIIGYLQQHGLLQPHHTTAPLDNMHE